MTLITANDGPNPGRVGRPRSTLAQLQAALEADSRPRPTIITITCLCGPTRLRVGPRDAAEDLLAKLEATRKRQFHGRCVHIDR